MRDARDGPAGTRAFGGAACAGRPFTQDAPEAAERWWSGLVVVWPAALSCAPSKTESAMPQKRPPSRAIFLPLGLACLAALSACGDYAADYPQLAPTESLLAPPKLPAHAADAAQDPEAVTGALISERNRLERRTGAAGQNSANDELAARAQRLRDRAAALRQQDPASSPASSPAASSADPAPSAPAPAAESPATDCPADPASPGTTAGNVSCTQ